MDVNVGEGEWMSVNVGGGGGDMCLCLFFVCVCLCLFVCVCVNSRWLVWRIREHVCARVCFLQNTYTCLWEPSLQTWT